MDVEKIRLQTPKESAFSLFMDDFKQLTKVRLAVSVVFSSVAGYFLAADTPVLIDVILLAFGGYFMVGASNAFNQVLEKDLDALMDRTKNRPLPSGRMSSVRYVDCSYSNRFGLIGFVYHQHAYSLVWRNFNLLICLCVYATQDKNSFGSFCRGFSRGHPLYAWMGCLFKSFWNRTWGIVYDTIFLAIPSLLGYWMDAR